MQVVRLVPVQLGQLSVACRKEDSSLLPSLNSMQNEVRKSNAYRVIHVIGGCMVVKMILRTFE